VTRIRVTTTGGRPGGSAPEGPDADEDNLTKLSPYGTLEEILAWVRTHPARRRILRTGDGEFDVTADGRVGARLMIPPDPSR
jgi:hypothetical protein